MKQPETPAGLAPRFAAQDIEQILREQGWLGAPVEGEAASGIAFWCEEAASLLGAQGRDRQGLEDLLRLIFHYDAREILGAAESQDVLARQGARDVIRALAHLVLAGPAIDSDRYKEIVSALKEGLHSSGRELFHPLRLALAGRAGQGELDRVILLVDRAAELPFAERVKGTRERMLEFCAALE
jgi:hypothetical protein